MNWQKLTNIFGRTVYKNDQYKIVLGKFPLIGGYWYWRGFKAINGKYVFIADYNYSAFDNPDKFVGQIDYEYSLQQKRKERERQLWLEINKSPNTK